MVVLYTNVIGHNKFRATRILPVPFVPGHHSISMKNPRTSHSFLSLRLVFALCYIYLSHCLNHLPLSDRELDVDSGSILGIF